MKYTIMGFSQQKLIELDLDLTDALILRWFIDFRDTNKMAPDMNFEDKKVYYWVRYEKLLKDVPIIKISSNDVLRRRLRKMVDKGVLIHYTKKAGGKFSFYNLGEQYKLLIDNNPYDSKVAPSDFKVAPYDSKVGTIRLKSSTHTTQKSDPYDSKVGTKDSSIKDSSIKDSSIKYIKEIFEFWNAKEIIKHTKLNDKIKTKINTILKSYKVDEVKKGIENYNTMLKDTDYVYCSYKWSLADFLSRANGFIEFLEDGSKWVNYQESKKSNTSSNQNYKQQPKKKDLFDLLKEIN
jgi:hypothetical protein